MTHPLTTQTPAASPDQQPGANGFYFLCAPDRENIYTTHLAETTNQPTRFFQDTHTLLIECLRHPPLALVIDMATQIALGSNDIAYLYDLKMAWPVLRCKHQSDNHFAVMCLHPMQVGALSDALQAIAARDPQWIPPTAQRHYPRAGLRCRARYRLADSPWQPSNTLNISAGGLFIITYDDLPKHTRLQVELLPPDRDPVTVTGVILNTRPWEDSPDPPGVGILVSDQAACDTLATLITQDPIENVFRSQSPT